MRFELSHEEYARIQELATEEQEELQDEADSVEEDGMMGTAAVEEGDEEFMVIIGRSIKFMLPSLRSWSKEIKQLPWMMYPKMKTLKMKRYVLLMC